MGFEMMVVMVGMGVRRAWSSARGLGLVSSVRVLCKLCSCVWLTFETRQLVVGPAWPWQQYRRQVCRHGKLGCE